MAHSLYYKLQLRPVLGSEPCMATESTGLAESAGSRREYLP